MVIGLLGGIGAGKSTVAGLFAEAGAEVVDADRLAHQVLSTPPAREKVKERFGALALGPDGRVDRRKLAERVFSDPEALRDLNAIVHPEVRERVRERVRHHRSKETTSLLVLDVPLLAGSPLLVECDALVYVEAQPQVRQARTSGRGWPPGELERRESHQAPLEEKWKLARFTVDNSGSLEATRAEVARVLRELRRTERKKADGT